MQKDVERLDFMNGYKEPIREYLKDGVFYEYKACSENTIENAKEYYKESGMEHVYSCFVYYINGTKNISSKLLHFFY